MLESCCCLKYSMELILQMCEIVLESRLAAIFSACACALHAGGTNLILDRKELPVALRADSAVLVNQRMYSCSLRQPPWQEI